MTIKKKPDAQDTGSAPPGPDSYFGMHWHAEAVRNLVQHRAELYLWANAQGGESHSALPVALVKLSPLGAVQGQEGGPMLTGPLDGKEGPMRACMDALWEAGYRPTGYQGTAQVALLKDERDYLRFLVDKLMDGLVGPDDDAGDPSVKYGGETELSDTLKVLEQKD